MGKPKRATGCVAFLWFSALVGCSAPQQSPAGAQAPPVTPTPTPAAIASAPPAAASTEAPAPGIAEGTLCGTRGVPGDCAEGLYCAYRSQCGATDTGGTCSKKPQVCTREYMPVCGCDNRTYANKCEAAHAGASVAAAGECKAK